MTKLPLSSRLLACCSFVRPGDRVADVGCDHGYLGIHLLLSGKARSVIASDVREMPLLMARRNGAKYGVSEHMQFFLTDGLQAIPKDFDTLVCAGMGADTMVSILSGAPWLRDSRYRLILQCQSKSHILRKYLSDNGWSIQDEITVRDGHFVYTVMEILFAPDFSALTPGECFFTPALRKHPGEETAEYFCRIMKMLRISVTSRGNGADPIMKNALEELTALAAQPDFLWLSEAKL